jgi:mRNA-degrading endonuclease RelE of RelBE toxin-antitoxin system
MDQIDKALKKLTGKERRQILEFLALIQAGQFSGLDLKKLVGSENTFRVRKGDLRIVFTNAKDGVRVLALERRSTTTYRKHRGF